jgi:hypothetical protein
MGIDIYDVMQGVGAGLVTEGNRRETKRKEELMQKLKLEDEARQEQREVAREERAAKREAAKVSKTEIRPNASGTMEELGYNSLGEVIVRREANPLATEEIEYTRKNRERDATIDDLTIRGKEADLEFAPVERDLRRRSLESDITYKQAQAERARREPDDKPEDEGAQKLREARQLIASRLLTPQQAAAKLAAAGYPELAAKLYRAPKADADE